MLYSVAFQLHNVRQLKMTKFSLHNWKDNGEKYLNKSISYS